MSMFSQASKFLKSKQGKEAIEKAKKFAQSEEGKEKIEGIKDKLTGHKDDDAPAAKKPAAKPAPAPTAADAQAPKADPAAPENPAA